MRTEKVGRAELYLADCMDLMKDYPDKAFDIAIVDPPYGDGGELAGQEAEQIRHRGVNHAYGGRFERYDPPESITDGGGCPSDIRHWDFAPPPEYFKELFRVSKRQIVWGGNYFSLPPSRNFIVWRKLTISEGFSMAMAEYAWTNIPGNAKVFECTPQGTKSKPRIHPTQKPVELYKWILSLYAKKGDKILDTHMGSGSLEVACIELGFDVVGIEINETYFNGALERIKTANKQRRLFD